MTVHELKSWPGFFDPVLLGLKTAEVRLDDRPHGFAVGDVLVLREFVPSPDALMKDHPRGRFTGRAVRVRVRYCTPLDLTGVHSHALICFVPDREEYVAP